MNNGEYEDACDLTRIRLAVRLLSEVSFENREDVDPMKFRATRTFLNEWAEELHENIQLGIDLTEL